MTFRARLTMAAAVAVAVAIALASFAVFLIVRRELRDQVDNNLTRLAAEGRFVRPGAIGGILVDLPDEPLGGAQGYAQLVGSEGPLAQSGEVALPWNQRTVRVALGREPDFFTDMSVQGTHIRVFTTQVAPFIAVQLARPMDEVDAILTTLKWILVVITGCGVALGAGLGGVVARAALAPVRRLTDATEHITSTGDLMHRIDVHDNNDELSRLATSFNAMLDALDASLKAQRQLVADASHELRTPITSLRTNIEVLAREERLTDEQRQELRRDIVTQLDELTSLVADVVELARGAEPEMLTEEVRLDEVMAEMVDQARRRAGELTFELTAAPTIVNAVPVRLERALRNLLDNAIKWSPPGGIVEVGVDDGEVTVRDHGPGISEEDLPHVFDRFYRSPDARNMPGSGLGLAIVRQVALAHGGSIAAERAEGGGARFRLRLPATQVEGA